MYKVCRGAYASSWRARTARTSSLISGFASILQNYQVMQNLSKDNKDPYQTGPML